MADGGVGCTMSGMEGDIAQQVLGGGSTGVKPCDKKEKNYDKYQ